jgi:hypothetical protein
MVYVIHQQLISKFLDPKWSGLLKLSEYFSISALLTLCDHEINQGRISVDFGEIDLYNFPIGGFDLYVEAVGRELFLRRSYYEHANDWIRAVKDEKCSIIRVFLSEVRGCYEKILKEKCAGDNFSYYSIMIAIDNC